MPHAQGRVNNNNSNSKCSTNNDDRLLRDMLGRLESLCPTFSDLCIHAVPEKLRKGHKEAFFPRSVYIGPFYYGKQRKALEDHKWRYLKSLLERTSGRTLKGCIESIRKLEGRVHRSYSENIDLTNDEFTKMVLLDGAFILELLLLHHFPSWRDKDDAYFHEQKQWVMTDVRRDLTLLENQLPFFVIEGLYKFFIPDNGIIFIGGTEFQVPSLRELVYRFFQFEACYSESSETATIKHLLDAVRFGYLPTGQNNVCDGRKKMEAVPSASMLQAAGVKLRAPSSSRSNNIFDIKFNKNKGVLEMPCLKLVPTMECLLRNLMAYEHCYYRDDTYFIDYINFMGCIISSRDDAKLLIRKKIINIENWQGNEEALVTMFSSLGRDTRRFWSRNITFYNLHQQLKSYFRTPFHRWKLATLKTTRSIPNTTTTNTTTLID